MSTPEGWHPDPTGRHQVRWWDGAQWTDWVGDNGQRSQDPLAGGTAATAAPGGDTSSAASAASTVPAQPDTAQVEHLLAQQRLFVEYGGGTFATAAWRTIADANQQPIGRIWREGRTARVCDLNGAPFMDVVASMQRSNLGDRDWSVTGLTVSAGGQQLANISWAQAKAVTLRFKQQGEKVLECRVERSITGAVKGGGLTAGDGRVLGTLTEWGRETSGMVLRSWLVLDKDPTIAEPLRSLCVAAPLVYDVFTNPVGRDRES